MKTKNNILKNGALKSTIVLLSGLLLGWLIFGGNNAHNHAQEEAITDEVVTTWTCSMHPQIRMDEPGQCPICGMDLIPLKTQDQSDHSLHEMDENAIQMTPEAVALANIQTTIIGHQTAIKNIQLYGTIQIDESLKHSQTSHVNGRIEELYVNFTGESVKQGQIIAKIYSPELMTAQQELLEAAKLNDAQSNNARPDLLAAVKEKLKLWKMTEEQISGILESKTVSPYVNIYANMDGVVVGKNVNRGDYINQGTVLYDFANLNQLWGVFEAYENDLPFLKTGDTLKFSLQSLPGEIFEGKIVFINPILDATSRTAKVRVEIDNYQNLFKPEMYAVATVNASLKNSNNGIPVPKSAILWTGTRSLVYVKEQDAAIPTYSMREIVLGASLGDSYMVTSGIENGEEVVTNGAFIIDASAQLEGKISMMNEKPEEEMDEHHHH